MLDDTPIGYFSSAVPELSQLRKVFVAVLLLLGLALALWGLRSFPQLPYSTLGTTLGAGLLMFFAAFLAGGTFGFIFGIPRTSTSDQADGRSGERKPQQVVNTNLEQISDWLTKALVGAGLVELQSIGAQTFKLAGVLASAFPAMEPGSGRGAALCLIVLGSAGGFLYTYIETRTFLAILFARSSEIEQSRLKARIINAAPQDISRPGVQINEGVKELAAKLVQRPFSSLATAEERMAWAKAQFWQRNFKEAAQAYEDVIKERPDDYHTRRDYGRALVMTRRAVQGRDQIRTAANAAFKAGSDLAWRYKIDLLWANLYCVHERGFEEAIRIGEEILMHAPELRDDARMNTYLASAYGQAARAVGGETPEWETFRQGAVDAILRVRRAPDSDRWLPLLRSLRDPAPGSDDDDLVAFKGDRAFDEVLG